MEHTIDGKPMANMAAKAVTTRANKKEMTKIIRKEYKKKGPKGK